MNYNIIRKLPKIDEYDIEKKLSTSHLTTIQMHRNEIKEILSGKDKRLIIIVGPCSAWPKSAVVHYAKKLAILSKKVEKDIKIIMRAYIQKPRTQLGWLGPAVQPNPFSPPNITDGIQYCRQMMYDIIKLGLPIASELLFTHSADTFQDLISWACIGARSSEDQEHRIYASLFDYPVGIKNPTHGDLKVNINSIIAAQNAHAATFNGYAIQTHGNPFAHSVLRGCNGQQNYSIEYLEQMHSLFKENAVQNPSILIDASHDNCIVNGKKNHLLQPYVIYNTLDELLEKTHLRKLIKGFMLESFLVGGNQKAQPGKNECQLTYGQSITDPCLSWKQTEELILKVAQRFSQKFERNKYKNAVNL